MIGCWINFTVDVLLQSHNPFSIHFGCDHGRESPGTFAAYALFAYMRRNSPQCMNTLCLAMALQPELNIVARLFHCFCPLSGDGK